LLGVIIWRSQPQQLESSFSRLGLVNVVLAALLSGTYP